MKKGFGKDTGLKRNQLDEGGAKNIFGAKLARRVLPCLLMALVCIGAFRLGSLYWWGDIRAEDEFDVTVKGVDLHALGLDEKLVEGAKIQLTYQPADADDDYQYEEAKSIDASGEVTFTLTRDGEYRLAIVGMLGYQDRELESEWEIQRNDENTHVHQVEQDDLDQSKFEAEGGYSVSISWNKNAADQVMIKSEDGSPLAATPSTEGEQAFLKTKDELLSTDSARITVKEKEGYVVEAVEIGGKKIGKGDIKEEGAHSISFSCKISDFIQRDAKEVRIRIELESTRPTLEIVRGEKGDWTRDASWKVTGRVERFLSGEDGTQSVELPIICLAEDEVSKDDPDWKKVVEKYLDENGKPKDQPYDELSYSDKKEFELSFSKEGEYAYWLYAVALDENRKVEDISAPKKITVRIDRTPPREQGHAFFDAGDGAREVHAQKGNGIFWNYGDMRLEVAFQDEASGLKKASGLKRATLKCDGNTYKEVTCKPSKEKGKVAFALETKDFQELRKITLELEDDAGNVAENVWEEEVFIKSVKPVITLELPREHYLEAGTDPKKWYRCGEDEIGRAVVKILPGSDIQIDGRGNIADEQLDLRNAVSYRVNDGASKSISVSGLEKTDSASNESQGEEYAFSFPISKAEWSALKEGRNTLSVTAENTQGEEETAEQAFYIDDSAPAYAKGIGMKFTTVNSQQYGSFSNEKVEIAAYVSDDPQQLHSGIREVRIYEKDVDSGEETVWTAKEDEREPGKYSVVVPRSNLTKYHKIISTVAEDCAGNVSGRFYPNELNSNIKAQNLMYEVQSPDVALDLPEGVADGNNSGKTWYGEHQNFSVKASDDDSGLRSVTVAINGKILGEDAQGKGMLAPEDAEKSQVKEVAYNFSTDQAFGNGDGSYRISVQAIDQAGNVKTVEKTVYMDLENPVIVGFRFEPEGSKEKKEANPTFITGKHPQKDVIVDKYGFYFQAKTKVRIFAEDAAPTAGIRKFSYYLVDQSGKYVDEKGNPIGEKGKEIRVCNTSQDSISVTVKSGFKGRIFARVEDYAGHMSPYRGPDGTVVESKRHHEEEGSEEGGHIAAKLEGSSYEDITVGSMLSNGEIYDKNVAVKVRVRDRYAGIRKIEWWVKAPYDKGKDQSGTLLVDNQGDLKSSTGSAGRDQSETGKKTAQSAQQKKAQDTGKKAAANTKKVYVAKSAGWNQKKKKGNLVTQLTKTFDVQHNSNDIAITVRMTDRAGNVSAGTYKLSIDTASPKMKVTYDNNSSDSQYKEYFKAERTATVEIRERNFDGDKFVPKIKNTEGVIPKVGSWTTIQNKKNPDETIHQAKIRFSADGDYAFSATFEDEAGNQAAPIRNQKFTIDKTPPVVNVAYDAGEAKATNGNYFSKERTATITIREHNFDAARVQIKGASTEAGKPIPFPAASNWSNSGDTHVATIKYADDGRYSFDIAVKDQAGNDSADYPRDQFFVDQEKPKIIIEGVKDGHAYNDEVKPVVICTDTNYDETKVHMELEGKNHDKKDINKNILRWTETSHGSGRKFEADDFPKEKKVDDLYTLTVRAEDRAGNVTEKKCEFSVNRFGSVYYFSGDLDSMSKKYVKKAGRIELEEVNISELDMGEMDLRMTKNGMPKRLINQDEANGITGNSGEGNQESEDSQNYGTYTVNKEKSPRKGRTGWFSYTYTLDEELFQGDGKYTVAVYSIDEAGNENENLDRNKTAEIVFGIDHTKPRAMAVNFEEGGQYDPDEDGKREMKIAVKDNLVLQDVKVEVDGDEIEGEGKEKGGCKHQGGDTYSFQLEGKNAPQDVTVTARDQAGNETLLQVEGVLISDDPLVRFMNHKRALWMAVLGVLVLAGGITALCIGLVRKRGRASA